MSDMCTDDVHALIAEVKRLTQERNDAESRCANAESELRTERRRHQETAVARDDLFQEHAGERQRADTNERVALAAMRMIAELNRQIEMTKPG